jgi:hypothetical protein
MSINRLIVRSAEDLIFHRDDLPWIPGFVAKNRNFQADTINDRIPAEGGLYCISRHAIVEQAT